MSSLPARMVLIKSKMKELECSQDFSHYKSMGIFTDAQGPLTPQSLVRSGRISNWSEMLWMSLLPASMKKIRSKMKALEWTQHYTAIFQIDPLVAEIFEFENVYPQTHGRTNGRTNGRRIDRYTISSPAQVS